jgi:hypothetical protein
MKIIMEASDIADITTSRNTLITISFKKPVLVDSDTEVIIPLKEIKQLMPFEEE